MSGNETKVPRLTTREITINVPDSWLEWFRGENLREAARYAGKRSGSLTREDLTERAAKLRESAEPWIHKGTEAASHAAATAAERSRPVVEELGDVASQARERVTEAAPVIALEARHRGSEVMHRAREEWAPAARERFEQTKPVVGDAIHQKLEDVSHSASLARHTADYGARSLSESLSESARQATRATGTGLKRFFTLVFWFGVVVWLLSRIFVPEKERRHAMYRKAKDLTGGSGF